MRTIKRRNKETYFELLKAGFKSSWSNKEVVEEEMKEMKMMKEMEEVEEETKK
jgi:hypothetical protein